MHNVKQLGKGKHSCSCGASGTVTDMLAHI